MINVIIEMKNGLIQQVYSNRKIHVNVIDWDAIQNACLNSPEEVQKEKEYYKELKKKTENMKIVW